jgi:preprotein translocase subunit SecG
LVRATTVAAAIFFATSLSLAIFAKSNAGFASPDGIPIINQDLLQELPSAPASDVPQLEVAPVSGDNQDVPSLPGVDN